MNWETVNETLQCFACPNYLYSGGALLALVLVLVLLGRRQPRNVTAYSNSGGKVTVSRSAITELVQTSCAQLDEVHRPSVKIATKGSTAHLRVSIKLASGGKLREVEQTLQDHLRHALTENLGIEKVGRIDITVTGFKSGKVTRNEHPSKSPALMDALDQRAADDESSSDETSGTKLL